MESPDYLQLSLAAAMQLGYSPARFYRGACMSCINLLLTYEDGCSANCTYCGLARDRQVVEDRSFIRVPWPTKPTGEILERIARNKKVARSCLSMITHRRAVRDSIALTERIARETGKPVSVLIGPSTMHEGDLEAIRDAGADRVDVAFDTPTEELFDEHRGRAVRGPHRWAKYWSIYEKAVKVFGPGKAGSHFMVGLGEEERELAEAFQRIADLGGENHLFSFFPEKGSALGEQSMPPMEIYRRIQIAAELIDSGASRAERFQFDESGRIVDYGVGDDELAAVIDSGRPFRTRGCPDEDGEVACNRPYANSLPGEGIRNYPFPPNKEDVALIRTQLNGLAGVP